MEIEYYLNKMKEIQISLLKYIEDEENIDQNYNDLIKLLNDNNILKNKYEFKSVLYLLLNISNHHHRGPCFFNQIFKILLFYSEAIKQYFTNHEIFNIFKSNNIIILFLIEEHIIVINDYLANIIKYQKSKSIFFFPEIKNFLDQKTLRSLSHEIPKNIETARKNGENDELICELIRKDSVDDFATFFKTTNMDVNSMIKRSVYETNSLLNENDVTLIEYAAFFGSMRIFYFLVSNGATLSPSLWIYGIHSQSMELIQYLKEKEICRHNSYFEKFLKESIKCHHIEVTKFIENNFFNNKEIEPDVLTKSLKHYNFEYIQKESINASIFYILCYYDYFLLVEKLLKIGKIDLNFKKIFLLVFL